LICKIFIGTNKALTSRAHGNISNQTASFFIFLYLIWLNSYFLIRIYCFHFRILDISYFKCKSRKWFRHFSTIFYFSTFNLKYFEFKILFKPNLANCTGPVRLLTMQLRSFYWWPTSFLLAINCLCLDLFYVWTIVLNT
jgi:hypothetical protein